MARAATGRAGIVALERSYHGATAGALSVSGDLRRKAAGGSSEVPGTSFAPNCYCYRCPLGLPIRSAVWRAPTSLDRILDREKGDVAAMIVEPVVGTNGVIVPVPEYLPEDPFDHPGPRGPPDRRRGDDRMGPHGRVVRGPTVRGDADLLTTAKGITSGYVPLGLTATTSAVFEKFKDRFLPVGHTYEAHPVALAAAEAAIGEYEAGDLIARSRSEGVHLLERLSEIATRHPSVGEVRGLGLFAAVELVRNGLPEPRSIPRRTRSRGDP